MSDNLILDITQWDPHEEPFHIYMARYRSLVYSKPMDSATRLTVMASIFKFNIPIIEFAHRQGLCNCGASSAEGHKNNLLTFPQRDRGMSH